LWIHNFNPDQAHEPGTIMIMMLLMLYMEDLPGLFCSINKNEKDSH
jgi:hypothetical protein